MPKRSQYLLPSTTHDLDNGYSLLVGRECGWYSYHGRCPTGYNQLFSLWLNLEQRDQPPCHLCFFFSSIDHLLKALAVATATETEFITRTANGTNGTMATAAANSTHRVPSQGGVFEGINPTSYDPKNPVTLFIIQASIVIGLTRALHWPLARINQPPVMAEVITGILLGPSVMGRVPGFTQHIFPTTSMPPFSLAGNLGLVLYLFLVGVEVDLRLLKRNWRVALGVGTLGMILPFGMGAAIAHGLYHQFRDDDEVVEINFSIYLAFIGVAMAITVSLYDSEDHNHLLPSWWFVANICNAQ